MTPRNNVSQSDGVGQSVICDLNEKVENGPGNSKIIRLRKDDFVWPNHEKQKIQKNSKNSISSTQTYLIVFW